MATFFKYKERDDISKSMIDWSGLTKKISDDLVGEKNRRDELKFQIEQDQQEKLKAVENVYQGLDPTMNQKMIELANNYKDYLVQQHDLMKRGLISVNDTKISKQGAMDTFNAINDATKVYGEKMQTFVDKGGNVNEFIAEKLAGALNIANSTLIIDPKSGRGTFVTTDESGNETAIPATAFNNVLNQTYERFDDKKVVADAVKNLGDYIKADSPYLSISDVRQNKPYYDKWKANQIKSILSNDNDVISAAADYLGMFPTLDKELVNSEPNKYFLAEAKGEKIVFDITGLREKISKKLDEDIEIAVSRVERRTAPPQGRSISDSEAVRRRKASELWDLSTRLTKGDSGAFEAMIGRPYTITDDKGTKKTAILGRPVLGADNVIRFFDETNSRVLTSVPLTGNMEQDAQRIAGIIESGSTATEIQALFREGRNLLGGVAGQFVGEAVSPTEFQSFIRTLPKAEDKFRVELKSVLGDDYEVREADILSNERVEITYKPTGKTTGVISTSDYDTIEDFLMKTEGKIPEVRRTGDKQEPGDDTDSLYEKKQ